MSLHEMWRTAAADNPEARAYLAGYERERFRARAAAAVTAVRQAPAPPPDETDTGPLFAFEFELRPGASLVWKLAEDPHQRTDLYRMLASVHPQQYRPALVRSLVDLAFRLEEEGDAQAAVAQLDEALEQARQLTGPDGDTTVARCLYERSRMALGLHGFDEALRGLREAATLPAPDLEVVTACARMRSTILDPYIALAVHEGKRTEAMSLLTEYTEVLRGLSEQDSTELPALARALNSLGGLRFEDDQAAGRAAVVEAVAIRRELVKADPGTQLPGLAAALNNLGFLSLRQRDLATARTSLAEAVSIRRGLAAEAFHDHGTTLLRSLNNLVFVLFDEGPTRQSELLDATAQARATAERLAADDVGARPDVAMALLHFAQARLLSGRELDEAAAAVDRLLSAYGAEASAIGVLPQATAMRDLLATR